MKRKEIKKEMTRPGGPYINWMSVWRPLPRGSHTYCFTSFCRGYNKVALWSMHHGSCNEDTEEEKVGGAAEEI